MTIFSKIIKGEIPSYKVFEDEHTFAFLDIHPIELGHTLVVPKIEVDYFLDVPEPYYSAVFKTAKHIGQAIHKASNCKRVGTIILGWDVPHFHYHMVPMFDHGALDFRRAKKHSDSAMREMQEKILKNL